VARLRGSAGSCASPGLRIPQMPRRDHSVARRLLLQAQDAALTAVQMLTRRCLRRRQARRSSWSRRSGRLPTPQPFPGGCGASTSAPGPSRRCTRTSRSTAPRPMARGGTSANASTTATRPTSGRTDSGAAGKCIGAAAPRASDATQFIRDCETAEAGHVAALAANGVSDTWDTNWGEAYLELEQLFARFQ
jgi:hypothetical protein